MKPVKTPGNPWKQEIKVEEGQLNLKREGDEIQVTGTGTGKLEIRPEDGSTTRICNESNRSRLEIAVICGPDIRAELQIFTGGSSTEQRLELEAGRGAGVKIKKALKPGRHRSETVLKLEDDSTVSFEEAWKVEEVQTDSTVEARHIGENTECMIDTGSVVTGEGLSTFKGVQRIREGASQASSFQKHRNLVTGEGNAYSTPQLKIEDPEVEASHASSTETLDEEARHYMESRGIPGEEAERLFRQAFINRFSEEVAEFLNES